MNTNKFLLATLAGAVILFLSGGLIYGLILPNIGIPPPESECLIEGGPIWIPILSDILFSGVFAYIFAKWANISTFLTGFKTGAILGAVLGLIISLMFYGTVNIFSTQIFPIAVISFFIRFGLLGGVIGWILGTGPKSE
jgi:hypothetical protein